MANDEILVICDLTLKRGADYAADIVIAEDNETPIDLTGYTAEAQIREFPESPDKEDFTCSVDSAGIHLSMAKETIDHIGYTQGRYDLFLTDPDNEIRTKLLQGNIFIVPEVTR